MLEPWGWPRVCHSKSMSRWAMNFSPGGLCNYRLCFKVDCVSIMFAAERERRREKVGEPDAREAETGWGRKGREREGEGERERKNPKVRNVQLTPPYWVWFYGLSSIQGSWNRDTLYDGPPVEGASRVTSLWGFYVTKIRLDMELAHDTRYKNVYRRKYAIMYSLTSLLFKDKREVFQSYHSEKVLHLNVLK